MQTLTDHIKFVLVETSHPGNIGAAARSIKNMGFNKLTLVAPKKYPSEVATWRAANAADVLNNAQVVSTLEEALKDCNLVFATSARYRAMPQEMITPRQAAMNILEKNNPRVAIVFGRESCGLHNDELLQAHYHLHIPTNPAYPVLNLAQAVQLISYEMFLATSEEPEQLTVKKFDSPATIQQMHYFFKHLELMLTSIGFLNPNNPGKLMAKLQRLFMRARPEKKELAILRGVLKYMSLFNENKNIKTNK